MKAKLLTAALLCLIITIQSFAQEITGVRNVHSVKVGLIGVGYAYEHALSRSITLNTELMLAGGFGGPYGAIVDPTLRVEPRFYYNFRKRVEQGKNGRYNAANYLSLAVENRFNVNALLAEAEGNNQISVIPKWGLRRTIGTHFFFEGAVGVGVSYDKYNEFQVAPGLDVRFGYAF